MIFKFLYFSESSVYIIWFIRILALRLYFLGRIKSTAARILVYMIYRVIEYIRIFHIYLKPQTLCEAPENSFKQLIFSSFLLVHVSSSVFNAEHRRYYTMIVSFYISFTLFSISYPLWRHCFESDMTSQSASQ